jgi:exodeoxyribonuclease-3
MRIVSWNVNGIRSLHRDGYLEPFLRATKPDVFCFQEIKANPDQLPEELLSVGDYSSFFRPCSVKKGYSGVALYSRIEPLSVVYGMGIPEFDDEGRLIGAEYEDFWLISAYFPNGGQGPHRIEYKLRYYESFLRFIEALRATKPVVFCGDVNTAHSPIDLARPNENAKTTGFLPEERAWIDRVLEQGYVDIYRHFNPATSGAYTYWDQITRARDRNVGWRIDYFFVSKEFSQHIKRADIHSEVLGSDHCPISITI